MVEEQEAVIFIHDPSLEKDEVKTLAADLRTEIVRDAKSSGTIF